MEYAYVNSCESSQNANVRNTAVEIDHRPLIQQQQITKDMNTNKMVYELCLSTRAPSALH